MGLLDYLWHTYQAINEREEAEAAHQNEYITVRACGGYVDYQGYHRGDTYVRGKMPRRIAEDMDESVFWRWVQRELPDAYRPTGPWRLEYDGTYRYIGHW